MLEAYEQQCDEACKIFAEYQRRLHHFVNQARDVRRSSIGVSGAADSIDDMQLQSDREDLYSSVKSNRLSEDLVETAGERSIRKACETLAANMIETIRSSFPAFEGSGINSTCQLDAAKLGIDLDGEIPTDVKSVALDSLKNPSLLLQSIITYTSRMKTLIHRETDKIDIRADAELLRYKYENEQVIDAASTDASSPLPYQVYGNGKTGSQLSTRGTYDQLLERQKEHVQQFLATEDALNKAAEAKALSQKLLERLQGTVDMAGSKKLLNGNTSQNVTNSRHLELDVWAKEREVAGLKASLSTLTSEVQRLYKLCAEWKEAEDSLRKKWKKIEEFDARRSELECIYSALQRANMDASSFWEQQPLSARGYAGRTIIPACTAVVEMSTNSRDLIERELSAFGQRLDNSLCKLPATPQALLEALGSNNATGSEALAAAEKHAALLTARAGARDPSAVPSICRISAALQYNSASILEDLSKAINLVHTRRNLVENDRVLLNRAHRAQQEYERVANYCLKLASEQEKVVSERWLPELRNAVQEARRCFEDCQRVRGCESTDTEARVAQEQLVHRLAKKAGLRPHAVDVDDAGTVINLWVPKHKLPAAGGEQRRKDKEDEQRGRRRLSVVLLHGFAGDGIMTWMFQVGALAKDYDVYVPDLLFFGGSTPLPAASDRSPAFQAECVVAALRRLGVERCAVVGFSYGGFVAFRMAEAHPGLVRSVVAHGHARRHDPLHQRRHAAEARRRVVGGGPPPTRRRRAQFMFKRKERAELLEGMVTGDGDDNAATIVPSSFRQNILLLWGEGDKIFDINLAKSLKEQLGQKATLRNISKAGHLAQLERPSVFNRCLREFLRSGESAGAYDDDVNVNVHVSGENCSE
ncbi:hypothetical protein PR202_gb22726 [Eleusine coracana subsp. coracana]|uniref:AB hydrolase-1 domain-containing protein n=1 Tax=Eleusine coracana subsp. coracana TaxID=191504 RepID=A0AAV5FHF3_ELECO|nr:hypothetical protein PR202_gb22726 [Eleusine coracana subsp. coracana]